MWVLGNSFLRQYYTIYNLDDATLTLSESINVQTTDDDSDTTAKILWGWIILLICGSAIGFCGASTLHFLKKRRERRDQRPLQPLMQEAE